MSETAIEEKTPQFGVDAHGNQVDLAEFEESFYKPGEADELLEEYGDSVTKVVDGSVVGGKILRITDKEVVVDVNFKSEGIIPLSEFKNVDEYKPGDEIEVFLEQVEDNEGQIILSKSRADFLRVWDKIYNAYENQETVVGRVQRRIKGGVVVDLFGVDAFLPGSQIDLRQIPDMDALINQEFDFRVIKVNKVRRNIVVSRRVILEENRQAQREKILAELDKDQVREGTVKNITDFGAFIDLGGVDGLLHITDMSWGRVNHPSEIVALGDKLKVKVLDFNENKERISLGLKQLTDHPWKGIEGKFPEGSRVRGKIVSITDYGAFMELEKGIEGLIHISEMSWTEHIKHPSKIVGIGDIVEAVVLNVDRESQKISLGFKQLEPDPWENVYEEFSVGSIIKGKVRNIAAFGAFVELKEGVDGLIHISDMSWTKKINHPGELLKKNDIIEVKVLNIDNDKRRISLGIKQLSEDPWNELASQFAVGTETECEIARILDRGLIVNLAEDVEGFVPLAKLAQQLQHPADVYKVGDSVPATVIEFDTEGKKIVLSIEEYFKGKDEEFARYCEEHPVAEAKQKEKKILKDPSEESTAEEKAVEIAAEAEAQTVPETADDTTLEDTAQEAPADQAASEDGENAADAPEATEQPAQEEQVAEESAQPQSSEEDKTE
ncbi:MAG: 30S ribosomal protein S1 [Chitinivibrionales bacterium]|nr:30S ribosomal protein S1 [Chitinivibrionales bacterium]